jgi:hypothetical protein
MLAGASGWAVNGSINPRIECQTSPLTYPAKRLRTVQQPTGKNVEISDHGFETNQSSLKNWHDHS